MKKALILHSWFGKTPDGWYPWLKAELEQRGYEVWLPQLPTFETKAPEMETAIKYILDKNFVDCETIVIGHSLGTLLAMRLSERIPFAHGILLAAWDFNDLTPEHASFWPNMLDHELMKKNVPRWTSIISDNDPYVTKAIAQEVIARLGGQAIFAGPKGHFMTENNEVTEVPEILSVI